MKIYIPSIVTLLVCLASLSMAAQEWHTHIDSAKVYAAEQSKPILLSFQGSDWCVPCIKLEKEIWHSEEFEAYAKDNLILLQADFPRRKKNALNNDQQAHNGMLAEAYNPSGIFPFVVLLNAKGVVLGETGYKKVKPQAYVEEIKAFIQ